MQPYQPISRELYEELEMRAVSRQQCRLVFKADNGGTVSVNTRIRFLKQESEGEYMITAEGLRIRLDQITALDGRVAAHWA